MEFLPTNRLLAFNTNQIQLVRQEYNLDKPGDMSQAIDVLEAWIKMQKHFVKKDLPRAFLEKAIIASKGSLERTKQRLDKLCTFRTVMSNFFGENLTKNTFENLDMFKNSLLPKPTDQNYRVFCLKSVGSTFTSEQLLCFYRYAVVICEYILAHDYSDGIVTVIDYTESNVIEIVKALNLTDLRQIIAIVTEGYAMRLKGIHLITQSKAIDTLVTIIKQLISPKLGKRICVHRDMSTLYEHVPKDLFPLEFGGKEKSLEKMHYEQLDELTGKDFMSYIEEMNKAKTDESYRQADTFNDKYIGMPGSFRTLNVD